MGTLGSYLRSAREAKDIDIRDAAQQTRISINYLKALEEEDFSKLPGEVFVRGFLKNYGKFLNLDEADILKRYAELKPQPAPASPPSGPANVEKNSSSSQNESRRETPVEPFIWGSILCISLLLFLFSSLPAKLHKNIPKPENQGLPGMPAGFPAADPTQSGKSDKLYLEVVALEDTWLLVRTDTSPQKKAVLKKGESLIWSADERFLLSYGRVSSVKLLLNGEELQVQGGKETPVRDLAVVRIGVVNQPAPAKQPQPVRVKRQQPSPDHQHHQPAVETRPSPGAETVKTQAPAPDATPATAPVEAPAPAPAPAPAQQ